MSASSARSQGSSRHHRRHVAAQLRRDTSKTVILAVPRDSIERGETKYSLSTLEAMLETPDSIRRLRGRLLIHVTGYERDGRELHQIPEARSFFAKLDAEFPYWFWFVNDDEPSFLITLLLCLVDKEGGDISSNVYDRDSLLASMRRHYEALDELGALSRLRAEEIANRQEAVGEYFKKYESSDAVATPAAPAAPAYYFTTLKALLTTAAVAALLLACYLGLGLGRPYTPLNVVGPILAGVAVGYLLTDNDELTSPEGLSRGCKLKLAAGMAVGTLAGILYDLLLHST